MQARGLFSDPTRLERLRSQRLADLEPRVRDGFSAYLGRQQLGDRYLQELDPAADGALSFQAVLGLLKQDGVLISRERREGLNAQRLGDLDKGLAAEIKNRLTEQLAADLAGKTMEQLPLRRAARFTRSWISTTTLSTPKRWAGMSAGRWRSCPASFSPAWSRISAGPGWRSGIGSCFTICP